MKDIRAWLLYREAEALCQMLRAPGSGRISDAAEIHAAPDGRHAVFAGAFLDALVGVPHTRICRTDLATGETHVLTCGPNTDRLPKYSPDGRHIAFLSDRHKQGDFQLYLLHAAGGTVDATPLIDGWVEYLHWSPDGRRIVLGVAAHGADVSSGQGAVATQQAGVTAQSWMPAVEGRDESCRWRRLWVYELDTHRVHPVGELNGNIWEAAWCGNEALAAIVSDAPDEGSWYRARLHLIDLATNKTREIYSPTVQIGCPAASPSGRYVAFVEALCSDRWIVAGELCLIDTRTGLNKKIDTTRIDIAHVEWCSDRKLLLAGHRGLESVVGVYDIETPLLTEVWSSVEISTGGFHVCVSGTGAAGDCVLIGEGFARAPEVGVIRAGEYHAVTSFDLGYAARVAACATAEPLQWRAPDGLEIQGWLLRPRGAGPFPLVMHIHGGPVWLWRPAWLGRKGLSTLMLLLRGYAVFLPNPRGSTGRGQDFARRILGDMGGADTHDCLSGIDHLIKIGVADPARIGVTGASYGGFMAAWLITQDPRFAAAVPVAPVTNHVTDLLLSNIPEFVALFMADSYRNPAGKYFERSPIMHAHKTKTPTLNICGALDRCTPPEEARQFHAALLENGVDSVLVTYPEEGHGIRKLPAVIDCAARVVDWFEKHMSPRACPSKLAHDELLRGPVEVSRP